MSNQLFLHVGAAASTNRHGLSMTPTPAPTKSWRPLAHSDLLREVEQTLSGSGLMVFDEAHGLARDGKRYFGVLSVRPVVTPYNVTNDYGLVIGLRNSHDKSFPAALAVGSRVFVCDNLAFSSEIVLARKHTTHILRDLPQLVSRAVGRLGEHRGLQDQRIDAYKATPLTDDDADHLIMEAHRRRVINLQRIDDVWQAWKEPQYYEFHDRTAWSFFNAVTETLKGAYFTLPQRTQALHGLLDDVSGVRALPSPKDE